MKKNLFTRGPLEHYLNISNKRDNCEPVSLRMAWDHSHFPSRQHHLYPVQGELLTGPFFHHTNRTHLLLENKTPYQTCAKLAQHYYKSGPAIFKGVLIPSSKQLYERLSSVDVVVFSLPSKAICYEKFWCAVSETIFTSCGIFWRSRKASQNTTMSKYTQRYCTPKRLISYLLPNCFISWAFFKKWEKRRR